MRHSRPNKSSSICEKQSGQSHQRYRHRSRSVSPGSIKKRNNARRLHFLKELENAARYIWNVSEKQSSSHRYAVSGLKGGGRKTAEKLDFERLASVIISVSISKESSKKEFWKAVAQNYFKTFTVDKKKVEQLRLIWRRNSGDIRGRVKYVHQGEELNNDNFNKNDPVLCMDDDEDEPIESSKHTQSHMGLQNTSNEGSMSSDKSIHDFFGRVVGRAVVTVYNEFCSGNQNQNRSSAVKGPAMTSPNLANLEVKECSNCSKMSTSPIPHPSFQSSKQHIEVKKKSPNHVFRIDSIESGNSLNCYERLDEDQSNSNNSQFLNMPGVSTMTVQTLSGSNVPSSGVLRAILTRPVTFVLLPIKWRDMPIKVIAPKGKSTGYRAFAEEYVTFFSNILKLLNGYCCWIFKKNYIKQENSRKKSSPYWRGHAICKYQDVEVQLRIADKEEGVLEVDFSGDVEHDVTQPKAKRITGKARQKLISDVWKTNNNPSKLHRDSLLNIDSNAFSAGIRTGAGITHGTMKGIKSESKKKHQSDKNLTTSLCELEASIKLKDEEAAIQLGHTWRKFFGYIQLCNVTPELNVVLFNEASVRIFHDLSKHDVIYVDATGKLFADEPKHSRLLYYAMVLRNPYHSNAPVPITELISSRQTADAIGLMIRKLKEKEKQVFGSTQNVIPSLIMSDFSMAIIIACLREFNNETYEEFLERGYRIVTGEANESDIGKSTHHVCSAHMLQIIKKHAKELCEKSLPIDSQVHIAKRFFGRLIVSTTLQELNNIVRLGHYIFKSKYIDSALLEILENFSEVVHDFDKVRCENEDKTCTEIDYSANTNFEDETFKTHDDLLKDVSVGTSMQAYWHRELSSMETNKATSGNLNKYFMPKYFEYVFKNYLPNCVIWSGLLLGDLRRYNEAYATKPVHTYYPPIRNAQVDNNTNAEVENFFRIKKSSSFKGKRHLRLDTFIGENWDDTKGIQREFVDGLIQGVGKRNKNLEKIEHICSSIPSNIDNISDNFDLDELSVSHCPEEQWHKTIPNECGSRKKGKYLSPSSKKLTFNPEFLQNPPNKSKIPNKNSSVELDRYEQSVKERQGNGFSKIIKKNDQVCCTCRQARSVSTVECLFCQESFHFDCVNFCKNLARTGKTNFFCANCIYIKYIPFLNYVFSSNNVQDLSRNNVIAKLYEDFSGVNLVLTKRKDSFFKNEAENVDVLYNVARERGMVNQKSNCWISSVLHCLSSTPLLSFLNRLRTTSHHSSLLNVLAESLKNLQIVPGRKMSAVRLCEGPLAVAESIGMIPDIRDHKDACEFLNKIFEGITSEIFEDELKDLNKIFQWKILSLNRCLVPECEKIFGKRVVMWNYPIQIPVTSTSINLQSLLWSHFNGRFTTEDDEVCKTCSCKPAAHHVELIEDIPNVLTFSINRVEFADTSRRIYTPIICDTTINLRRMTAQNFDEADLKCTLLAAILHKGPFVQHGHFVAYVFNTASTAILYDDTIVKEVCSKNLITSPEFMKNVYMCFYFKGDRAFDRKAQQSVKSSDKNDDKTSNSNCLLSSDDISLVQQAWSYQKEILFGTVSTFDLH